MNLSETLQLLDKLREVGVQRFKSSDLEIYFSLGRPITVHTRPDQANATLVVSENPDPSTVVHPHNPENTSKVQELIDLLQMKDEELVNKIFPAGA